MIALWGIEVSGELPLGDLLVGLGTFALAGFTARLARATNRDVGKADEAIAAQDMPFVIPGSQGESAMDFELNPGSGRWELNLRLWNIGKGPAMVRDVRLASEAGSEELERLSNQRPVATGDVHDLSIELATDFPEDGVEPFYRPTLRIYYTHADGTELVTIAQLEVVGFSAHPRDFVRALSDLRARPLADPDLYV